MTISKVESTGLAMLIKDKDMNAFAMPLYSCHKQVHATPLSRGLYNAARGWGVPKDENPDDEGYLVVYNRGTIDEYVSWSPKHIFDAGYSEFKELTYLDGLRAEVSELDVKISALSDLIKTSPVFDGLSEMEQLRMKTQLSAMLSYSYVLSERIGAAE